MKRTIRSGIGRRRKNDRTLVPLTGDYDGGGGRARRGAPGWRGRGTTTGRVGVTQRKVYLGTKETAGVQTRGWSLAGPDLTTVKRLNGTRVHRIRLGEASNLVG